MFFWKNSQIFVTCSMVMLLDDFVEEEVIWISIHSIRTSLLVSQTSPIKHSSKKSPNVLPVLSSCSSKSQVFLMCSPSNLYGFALLPDLSVTWKIFFFVILLNVWLLNDGTKIRQTSDIIKHLPYFFLVIIQILFFESCEGVKNVFIKNYTVCLIIFVDFQYNTFNVCFTSSL